VDSSVKCGNVTVRTHQNKTFNSYVTEIQLIRFKIALWTRSKGSYDFTFNALR